MTIRDDRELELLRAAGRVVAEALDAMEAAVQPGISTGELDAIAARVFRARGARSAPRLVYRFPGETCVSVNDEVVHGIPGDRVLRAGDLVKLDVTAEKGGFMADAARTVVVGGGAADGVAGRLARCARVAFERALADAQPGRRVAGIGSRVESVVRSQGFSVIRELAGHGIGRTIHEPPTVPNYDDPGARARLAEGMVLTIEPIISAGGGAIYLAPDGWTVRTQDRALAAHHEHTIVIARRGPILLTAA